MKWFNVLRSMALVRPQPSITTAIWRSRKKFCQWQCSLHWLRQHRITAVIQAPGALSNDRKRLGKACIVYLKSVGHHVRSLYTYITQDGGLEIWTCVSCICELVSEKHNSSLKWFSYVCFVLICQYHHLCYASFMKRFHFHSIHLVSFVHISIGWRQGDCIVVC